MTQAGELSEESLANPVVVLALLGGEEEELSLCALYFMSKRMMEIMLWEEVPGPLWQACSAGPARPATGKTSCSSMKSWGQFTQLAGCVWKNISSPGHAQPNRQTVDRRESCANRIRTL